MINKVESTRPVTKRNNAHLMLTTAAGAAIGAGVRYVLPTKSEMGSLKNNADTFFSNASTAARGANRSILKYSAFGAIVAAGTYLISKLLKNKQAEMKQQIDSEEYNRILALLDSPDYACEILLYQ